MSFFLFALVAVVLVAALSREYERPALRQVAVTTELDLDPRTLLSLPDRIHVSLCSRGSLTHPDLVGEVGEALRSEGFRDLGSYAIDELHGVLVVLHLNPRDGLYAVTYDHARAGVWVDVVSCGAEGRRCTHTTLTGYGHETRPDHVRVVLPGASVFELVARARADRPDAPRRLIRRDVLPLFEQGYSDWIQWRKAAELGEHATTTEPIEFEGEGEVRKAA